MEPGQNARLIAIEQLASAQPVSKETPWLLALKLVVVPAQSALTMKNAKIENAKGFANHQLVPMEPHVVHVTTKRFALVILPYKETATPTVTNHNVRQILAVKFLVFWIRHRFKSRPFISLAVEDDPECEVDRDCPSQMACIDTICQNPCRINNPCLGEQQCVVKDTLPTRSVACVCPDGSLFGNNGQCKTGNKNSKGLI